jgi:hypothetical protein
VDTGSRSENAPRQKAKAVCLEIIVRLDEIVTCRPARRVILIRLFYFINRPLIFAVL